MAEMYPELAGTSSPAPITPEQLNFAPTTLNDEEEVQFRSWVSELPWFYDILNEVAAAEKMKPTRDLSDWLLNQLVADGEYDYRGAWKEGVFPTLNEFDRRYHWPSKSPSGRWLKAPTHPTAWKETFMQTFGVDPDRLQGITGF